MKKSFLFFAFAAITLAFVACKDNNDPEYNNPEWNNVSKDALSGEFSVSATEKVQFSSGNLLANYDGKDWSWAFAGHQWYCIGAAVANTTMTDNDTVFSKGMVDLFCWSTDSTYYGINKKTSNNVYSGDFKDWGETIGEGWRTLSRDEWVYLFHQREKAVDLFGLGSVNGIKGLIILPDDWSLPQGATFNKNDSTFVWHSKGYYYNSIGYSNVFNFTQNTYTKEQWSVMESAGAVFLPAAGYRSGTVVDFVGRNGVYWSSTYVNDTVNVNDTVMIRPMAYAVSFGLDNLNPQSDCNRGYGRSVRLVRQSE